MATLLYHWDFHEGSGTDLADIVGTNEGTLRYGTSGTLGVGPSTNGPEWVAGRGDGNYALRFADSKTNFVATTTPLSNPTNFSLSAWFKTTVACGQKVFGFERLQLGISEQYDRILYVGTDGKLKYGHWNFGSQLVSSSGIVTDGQWHHAAVLLETSGQYSLYLDGSFQASLTVSPEVYTGYWRIGGSNFTSYGGCWAYSNCAGGMGAFDGDITDVRVYSGVLTPDEIYDLASVIVIGLVGLVGTGAIGSVFVRARPTYPSPPTHSLKYYPLPPPKAEAQLPVWSYNELLRVRNALEAHEATTISFGQMVLVESVGGVANVRWPAGQKQKVRLTENTTVVFEPPLGACNVVLEVEQAGAGGWTLVLPAEVKWPGGVTPTWSTRSGALDIVPMYFDGADYHAVASLWG